MKKKLYKVTFLSQGRTLELYARHVESSSLWGFTQISDLDFSHSETVVVDPTEEKLRDEFKDTKVLHIPMQCVVRIEEVEKRGKLSIRDAQNGEKVVPDVIRPFPMVPPRDKKD